MAAPSNWALTSVRDSSLDRVVREIPDRREILKRGPGQALLESAYLSTDSAK
jgi:hypothetical protein